MEKHVNKGTYNADIVYGIYGNAVKYNVGEGDKADNKKASLLLSAVYKVIGEER